MPVLTHLGLKKATLSTDGSVVFIACVSVHQNKNRGLNFVSSLCVFVFRFVFYETELVTHSWKSHVDVRKAEVEVQPHTPGKGRPFSNITLNN